MRAKIGNKNILPGDDDAELRLVRSLYIYEAQADGLLAHVRRKLQQQDATNSPSREDVKSMQSVDREHRKALFQ